MEEKLSLQLARRILWIILCQWEPERCFVCYSIKNNPLINKTYSYDSICIID